MTTITAAEIVTRGFIMGLSYDHTNNRMIEVYELNDQYYVVDQASIKYFKTLDEANKYAEEAAGN
jgi:hypothetical protein